MKWKLLLATGLWLTSCAHPGVDAEREARDRHDVAKIEDRFNDGQLPQALAEAHDFSKDRPRSVYLQAARFLEARILEAMHRTAEADALYASVREASIGREPKLATQAEWHRSFTAEALGDDFRALTHVASAERRSEDLTPEQLSVELPARKALLLSRLGQEADAQAEVVKAEAGLRRFLSMPDSKMSPAKRAQLHFDMGRSVRDQVAPDELAAAIRALRFSQIYLLRAIADRDATWSPKAAQALKSAYIACWSTVSALPAEPGLPADAALRAKRQAQIPHLIEILKAADEADLRRPLKETDASASQKEVFSLLDQFRAAAQRVLYANSESTILTEESRQLHGLKRDVLVVPIKTSSDPNL